MPALQQSTEDYAADVAASIAKADQDAYDAAAAFAAGRFPEYFALKSEQVRKRLEAAGERAIANAGSS